MLVSEETSMAPLPTTPSTSPRTLLHSNSSEWHVVVQRNIKSSLLLLLVLSTVFVFSVVYSSRGFGAATTGETLTQSPLDTDLDVSRLALGEEQGDGPIVPAENYNVEAEQSLASGISLPSANTSVPAVSAPSTGASDQSKCKHILSVPCVNYHRLVIRRLMRLTLSRLGEVGAQVEQKCDMSMGRWVREPKGPVYTNLTCLTLPDFKNCQKYGKDPGHLFWRWQPDACDLPRFSPELFLDVVRGKRLAFIGDSLARNQMESLLCLLSQVST